VENNKPGCFRLSLALWRSKPRHLENAELLREQHPLLLPESDVHNFATIHNAGFFFAMSFLFPVWLNHTKAIITL
jgi:hypothetical protein